MDTIFFVAFFFTLLGGLFRLWLGKYKHHLKRDVFIAIAVGVVLGIVSIFYQELFFVFPLTKEKYVGLATIFFMIGYVLCDLADSFIFIAKRVIK